MTDYTINLRNQSEQSNIFPITFPSTTKRSAKIYFVDTQKWIARCQTLPKQIDTTPLQRCLPNAVPSETQRTSRKQSLAMLTEEDEPKRSAANRCRSLRIWRETRGQDGHLPSTLGGWSAIFSENIGGRPEMSNLLRAWPDMRPQNRSQLARGGGWEDVRSKVRYEFPNPLHTSLPIPLLVVCKGEPSPHSIPLRLPKGAAGTPSDCL